MMKIPLSFLPTHRPGDDPKTSDPESQLSPDILAALVQNVSRNSPENLSEAVERLIVDIRERVLADTDPEAAGELGKLITYKEVLQKRGIDKAA